MISSCLSCGMTCVCSVNANFCINLVTLNGITIHLNIKLCEGSRFLLLRTGQNFTAQLNERNVELCSVAVIKCSLSLYNGTF
jgi:hypothetical protein